MHDRRPPKLAQRFEVSPEKPGVWQDENNWTMRVQDPLVEQRLHCELEARRAAYCHAKGLFESRNQSALEMGTDNHPAATGELLNAAREYSHCLNQYMAALQRFSEFVLGHEDSVEI
jgi:hypothetical protein